MDANRFTSLGAVLVPPNRRLAPAEIAAVVVDAEPALLFVEQTLEGLLSEVDRDALVCLPFEDVEATSCFIQLSMIGIRQCPSAGRTRRCWCIRPAPPDALRAP